MKLSKVILFTAACSAFMAPQANAGSGALILTVVIHAAKDVAEIVQDLLGSEEWPDGGYGEKVLPSLGGKFVGDIDTTNAVGLNVDDSWESVLAQSGVEISNLKVSHGGPAAFGVYHGNGLPGNTESFGSIYVENATISNGNSGASNGSSGESAKAVGVYQEANKTFIETYERPAVTFAGTVTATYGFAVGLAGGTYNGRVDLLGLTVKSLNSYAVGVFAGTLNNGGISNVRQLTSSKTEKWLTVMSEKSTAVGFFSNGGNVSTEISNYNFAVYTSLNDDSVDSAAVGLHFAPEAGTTASASILNTSVKTTTNYGLSVGVSIDGTNGAVTLSSVSGLTVDALSYSGRAVGISVAETSNNKLAEITNSSVSVKANGDVYGMAIGKNVSAVDESTKGEGAQQYSASPIGGVAIYNSDTEDSSGVQIADSTIKAVSSGVREDNAGKTHQNAYGLYVTNGKSYTGSNTFFAESSGKAYGIYADAGATDGAKGVTALSTASSAYGIYATGDNTTVESVNVAATGTNITYGVYADSGAEVSTYTVKAKSESNVAYGAYVDGASATIGVSVEATSASDNNTYAVYANNANVSCGSLYSISSGTGDAYGVFLNEATFSGAGTISLSGEDDVYGIFASGDSTVRTSSLTLEVVNLDAKNLYSVYGEGNSKIEDVSIKTGSLRTEKAYGLYLKDNSEYTLTEKRTIELGTGKLYVNATVYGAYLTDASSIDGGTGNNLSFVVETTESGADAYGLCLLGNATAKDVGTVSVTAKNSAAYGVVLSGAGSVEANSVTASGTSATGIRVANDSSTTERRTHSISGTIKATSVNPDSVDSANYENYVAVDVQDEAVLNFDGAELSALGGKGVALKSSGDVALTISGNAMLNGDVLAGTRGDQVLNVTSGAFTFKSSGVSASEIVLGTETSVAVITLGGQDLATNFKVGTLTFHAQQDRNSTLKIAADVSVSDTVSQINVKFADGFTCKSGGFVMFVVGNGIADDATLVDAGSSALSVSVSIGGVALSENAYSWTSGNVDGVNGYGILFAVPEPSAFGLLAGLGALALCAARRRRSR